MGGASDPPGRAVSPGAVSSTLRAVFSVLRRATTVIRVDRSRIEKPPILDGPARSALQEVVRFYEQSEAYRSQHRHEFEDGIWTDREVERALEKLFNKKCAFCEAGVSGTNPLVVSHFRPKEGATGIRRGQLAAEHYSWLAYEWSNLYLVCTACNRYKSSSFPVSRARATPGAGRRALLAEDPLLLDPCEDDPEAVLDYTYEGKVRGGDLRSELTIEVLGLNRPGLVADRKAAYRDMKQLKTRLRKRRSQVVRNDGEPWRSFVFSVFRQLRPKVVDKAEFAGLKRQVARQILKGLRIKLEEAPAELEIPDLTRPQLPRQPAAGSARLKRRKEILKELRSVWITSVEICNFKGIHELKIDFPPTHSGRDPWVMLIGSNGVGKSSILQAIALALSHHTTREKLVPDASSCVNHCTPESKGYIVVGLNTGHTIELRFNENSSKFKRRFRQKESLPEIRLLGFGSTRLPPRRHERDVRLAGRVDNLFDPRLPLHDPEHWLTNTRKIPTHRFNPLKPVLRELLSFDDDVEITRRNRTLYVHQYDGRYCLRESSDGYQTVVTLAVEIMKNLSASGCCGHDVEGTVLLDEIEVHLHPSWKIRIVSTLRKLFPHVRFIVTTHDPLCLRGLEDGEICILDRDEKDRVQSRPMTVPAGLRADQLLTGEWFGLNSTLDEETRVLMEEHRQLLVRKGKTRSEGQRQRAIEQQLRRRLGTFADTSVDRMFLELGAEEMRKRKVGDMTLKDRRKLRDKVQERFRLRMNA